MLHKFSGPSDGCCTPCRSVLCLSNVGIVHIYIDYITAEMMVIVVVQRTATIMRF
jgi:hypothetical protein